MRACVFSLLLQKTMVDNSGHTALDIARHHGHDHIIHLLGTFASATCISVHLHMCACECLITVLPWHSSKCPSLPVRTRCSHVSSSPLFLFFFLPSPRFHPFHTAPKLTTGVPHQQPPDKTPSQGDAAAALGGSTGVGGDGGDDDDDIDSELSAVHGDDKSDLDLFSDDDDDDDNLGDGGQSAGQMSQQPPAKAAKTQRGGTAQSQQPLQQQQRQQQRQPGFAQPTFSDDEEEEDGEGDDYDDASIATGSALAANAAKRSQQQEQEQKGQGKKTKAAEADGQEPAADDGSDDFSFSDSDEATLRDKVC